MDSSVLRNTLISTSEPGRRIKINVGGKHYSPYVSTLQNLPDSPLTKILKGDLKFELDYDPITGEYFFDRHPGIFVQILNYFQTGKLHCPRDVCGTMFQSELNFWGVDETQMEACCWPAYTKFQEIKKDLQELNDAKDKKLKFGLSEKYPISGWKHYQKVIWSLLNDPKSSNAAKIFSYISLGFIVISIVAFSEMTTDWKKSKCLTINRFNKTIPNCIDVTSTSRNIEIVLTVWFTLEIVLRIYFTPNKIHYVKNVWNWFYIFAVVPIYLFLITEPSSSSVMTINVLRYASVIRFFKLLYDLEILGKTLQSSLNQLFTLVFILCIPAIIFSSIAYFAEQTWGEKTQKHTFKDVPNVLWWSIITMTTIGYGDMVPSSFAGKIIGIMSTLVGIVILSVIASILGASFQQNYILAIMQYRNPPKKTSAVKIINVSLNNYLTGAEEINKRNINSSLKTFHSNDSGYGKSPLSSLNHYSEEYENKFCFYKINTNFHGNPVIITK
ncbi:potassium voltage-gated channel subfamily C member 1 isoform X1 [Hydra vulgaris]|uniref:potassium voltage-gated channel subfamily C member 1 isoform X1 n=1 Tax=Hydra vulgaris TaxID=6087 RepID=UPI0002B42F74|nr:potassium voltage-gated channel subfamily C member 1 isoform X1 [Hydra vulgaris]